MFQIETKKNHDLFIANQPIITFGVVNTRTRVKFYIFFNNHARGQAVANALMLKSELASDHKMRAPEALVEAFPELKNFAGGDERGQLDLG